MMLLMLTCALQAQVDMADAALWLYGVAFEELQRHIAVECRQRSHDAADADAADADAHH